MTGTSTSTSTSTSTNSNYELEDTPTQWYDVNKIPPKEGLLVNTIGAQGYQQLLMWKKIGKTVKWFYNESLGYAQYTPMFWKPLR